MFMQPQIAVGEFVTTDDGTAVPTEHYTEEDHGKEEGRETGYFCRLSAPGYLDATDWSGPFDTACAALEHLVNTWAEDDAEESQIRDYFPDLAAGS